jgi:hypothetical protein
MAKSCNKNKRGTFSVGAALGFDMFLYDPQLNFRGDELTEDMAPPCVVAMEYMTTVVTENNRQVGHTFLAWLESLEEQARSRGVTGPICFATDGDASRYALQVQKWVIDNDHDLFITPAAATGTCCPLDQIFQSDSDSYIERAHFIVNFQFPQLIFFSLC